MANIIELFKDRVPTRKKVFNSVLYSNNEHRNLSYAKFKKDNYELKILSIYFLCMDNNDYLDEETIKNIFNYLSINLRYNCFTTARKTVSYLNLIKSQINRKKLSLDEDNNKELIDSLSIINYYINLLKIIISNKYDMNIDEFEKVLEFETVTRKILKPNAYDEKEALKMIFDNIKLLNYHDHRERTFTDLLCNYYNYAKNYDNEKQINYYEQIIKYILNIKNLNINKRKLYSIFDFNYIDVIGSNALNNKIKSLEYDYNLGRFYFDDFTFSIDNSQTIIFDDALSIEKTDNNTYILGIHITDVYSLGNFDLNDEHITTDNFNKVRGSLNQQKRKETISLFVEISESGVILDYKIIPTILYVDNNLTYNDVAKVLYNKENKTVLDKSINDLVDLYLTVENKLMTNHLSLSNIGAVLVEKYMLLNSCLYGEYFNKNDIPGIFLTGNRKEYTYTLDALPYSAGFENLNFYSKSTSPIYDKSSLLCQYVLHKCAFRNVPSTYKELLRYKLKPIVNQMNKIED